MNVSTITMCQNVSTNLDGFWFFPSQLTSPILPFKTCHKLGVGCACGLISLGIFFKFNSIDCGFMVHNVIFHRVLTSFNLCPKPFLHLMEFPWANSSSFWLAKVVKIRADEKGDNLSYLLAEKEP